jgi:hypothetical protein
MSNVVAFPTSLLAPFFGTWIRDPMSVSRNKVAKRMLGEDGLKRLWRCGSIAELRQCLQEDTGLAEKYAALCGSGAEGRLVIARHLMTWSKSATPLAAARTVSSAITRVTAEGRMIIVHNAPRPTVSAHALRRKGEWLLVSELYAGRNVLYFPPSPVFRYYRADRNAPGLDTRTVSLSAPDIA